MNLEVDTEEAWTNKKVKRDFTEVEVALEVIMPIDHLELTEKEEVITEVEVNSEAIEEASEMTEMSSDMIEKNK